MVKFAKIKEALEFSAEHELPIELGPDEAEVVLNKIEQLAKETGKAIAEARERDAQMMDICRSALSFTLAIRNDNHRKAHGYMLELEAMASEYSKQVKP